MDMQTRLTRVLAVLLSDRGGEAEIDQAEFEAGGDLGSISFIAGAGKVRMKLHATKEASDAWIEAHKLPESVDAGGEG